MLLLIDIRHRIYNNMPSYPEDCKTIINYTKSIASDGYVLSEYHTSLHTGTHIDFSKHIINSDTTASEYPLTRFCSKGWIIDVRGSMNIAVTEEFKVIGKNDIVILYTGFEDKFYEESYFTEHPVIHVKTAEYLVQKEISIIGFDMPSCDYFPFETHKTFMRGDILILENLTNLKILNKYTKNSYINSIYAFPLNISAEASQVRVIADVI